MMGNRDKLKSGDEWDAVSGWGRRCLFGGLIDTPINFFCVPPQKELDELTRLVRLVFSEEARTMNATFRQEIIRGMVLRSPGHGDIFWPAGFLAWKGMRWQLTRKKLERFHGPVCLVRT